VIVTCTETARSVRQVGMNVVALRTKVASITGDFVVCCLFVPLYARLVVQTAPLDTRHVANQSSCINPTSLDEDSTVRVRCHEMTLLYQIRNIPSFIKIVSPCYNDCSPQPLTFLNIDLVLSRTVDYRSPECLRHYWRF
jgi:hypothetical protein